MCQRRGKTKSVFNWMEYIWLACTPNSLYIFADAVCGASRHFWQQPLHLSRRQPNQVTWPCHHGHIGGDPPDNLELVVRVQASPSSSITAVLLPVFLHEHLTVQYAYGQRFVELMSLMISLLGLGLALLEGCNDLIAHFSINKAS